jgi:hypothetical protein
MGSLQRQYDLAGALWRGPRLAEQVGWSEVEVEVALSLGLTLDFPCRSSLVAAFQPTNRRVSSGGVDLSRTVPLSVRFTSSQLEQMATGHRMIGGR